MSDWECLSPDDFRRWLVDDALFYRGDVQTISFSKSADERDQFLARIPIGDYQLQLDYRIRAALSLVPADAGLLLARRSLTWRATEATPSGTALDALLQACGILATEGAIRLGPDQRALATALIYLTNRWGSSAASFYVIPDAASNVLLYACGSTESLFIETRDMSTHDECVEKLRSQNVPAYGPHVKDPLPLPTYGAIRHGRQLVQVDPRTGRLVGPGSEESSLSREFLPPD